MRFICFFAALAVLSACATPAPPATAASTPTAPATPQSPPASRVAQMLAAAGRPDAATQSEVERLIGRADIVRQDGAGAALTYRMQSCALMLLFTADGRNAMRLAEAHPSARRPGDAAPSMDQCAAEADQRR